MADADPTALPSVPTIELALPLDLQGAPIITVTP